MNGKIDVCFGRYRQEVVINNNACLDGFGANFGGCCFAGKWAHSLSPYEGKSFEKNWLPSPSLAHKLEGNINYLELIAVCVALLVWSPSLVKKHVVIQTDNMATVAFINRGTTRDCDALRWLRLVFYNSLKYDFRYSAVHCPGAQNVIADKLSRIVVDQSAIAVVKQLVPNFSSFSLSCSAFCSYPTSESGVSPAEFEKKLHHEFVVGYQKKSMAPVFPLLRRIPS